MRKTLASGIIIVFAGLLFISLLTIFKGNAVSSPYGDRQATQYHEHTSY